MKVEKWKSTTRQLMFVYTSISSIFFRRGKIKHGMAYHLNYELKVDASLDETQLNKQ